MLLGKTHGEAVAVLRAAADPITLRVIPVRAPAQRAAETGTVGVVPAAAAAATAATEVTTPVKAEPATSVDTSATPDTGLLMRKPSRVAPPPPSGKTPLSTSRRTKVCTCALL